jgi:multidrug efflux pump subunit AcrA (membrane-fusion protein)
MKRNFIVIVLIPVFALLITGCKEKSAGALPPPNVQVVEVIQQDIPVMEEFVGQTYGLFDIALQARVDGFLEGIYFEEGRGVKKGQLLYTIAPEPYEAKVAVAKGQLAEANTRLVKAENDLVRIKPLAEINAVSQSDLSSLLSTDALLYSVGGSILGPIFNWGKNKRRVDIQKEVASQALYRYEQAVLNAFREVDDALIDVNTYGREVESRERQKAAATNAALLSRARYDGGQTAYLEVLDTERSLFNAELETTAVKGSLLSSYLFLYKALGGGWITPAEEASVEETP